jgi:hypothetical protein
MGKAIAEHWDGSNWHLVNVAPPGSGGSELSAVDAVAPDDVWAVGTHAGSTLTEHFDGTAWSVVPSPNGDLGDGILSAVVAIAPDDAWAAGATGSDGGSRAASRGDGGGGGGGETTLILHWDGSQWTVVPSPNGPNPSNVLDDLVAFGPNKVWAGGSSYDDLAVTSRSLVERWDGTGWRVVKSPNPDPDYTTLIGIGGRGPRDLWAVGAQGRLTLALHR